MDLPFQNEAGDGTYSVEPSEDKTDCEADWNTRAGERTEAGNIFTG